MKLTLDQESAFQNIKLNLEKQHVVLLHGSAGTGKTTMTKAIANYYIQKGGVCIIAPTHKAKHVIEDVINEGKIIPVLAFTVASILSKLKEHSYLGTKNYSNPNNKKFSIYNFFILDEVSMCSDADIKYIVEYVRTHGKKLLLVGDKYQIPNPNAPYIIGTATIQKSDSYVFSDPDIPKIELIEVLRQSKESNILQLASFIRDHIDEYFEMTNYNDMILEDKLYNKYRILYNISPESTKVIAYTNQAVRTHNLEVRRILGYQEKLVVGDILVGYSNLGWPELFIENGQDYVVEKVEYTAKHNVSKFANLCGHYVTLITLPHKKISKRMFFLDVCREENSEFLKDLFTRAEKVNAPHSTKKEYSHYCELKNGIVCMGDLYKYKDVIFEEADFKEMHSLLFTKTLDVITNSQIYGDKVIIKSKIVDKISSIYPGLIECRIQDDKMICDSEILADQFKFIEKDIFYGYAITAHKSQGSTYDYVFMDETDFFRINDRFNYKYNKLEIRNREKNQLRYVAVSRAKKELYIIQNNHKNSENVLNIIENFTNSIIL